MIGLPEEIASLALLLVESVVDRRQEHLNSCISIPTYDVVGLESAVNLRSCADRAIIAYGRYFALKLGTLGGGDVIDSVLHIGSPHL